MSEIREKLAKLSHEQWCGWMAYLFSKSIICQSGKLGKIQAEDGALIIPKWAVDRWTRQVNTAYDELSEKEKDSDRTEADKCLALLKQPTGDVAELYAELIKRENRISQLHDKTVELQTGLNYQANIATKAHAERDKFKGMYEVAIKRVAKLQGEVKGLIEVMKLAYRKHHLNDPDIGWDELSDKLLDTLCNSMGNDGFQEWRDQALRQKGGE